MPRYGKKAASKVEKSDARTKGRHAQERSFREEGHQPEASDRDRAFRGSPRRGKGPREEGIDLEAGQLQAGRLQERVESEAVDHEVVGREETFDETFDDGRAPAYGSVSNLVDLPTHDARGAVRVVVETPAQHRQARYDPEVEAFVFGALSFRVSIRTTGASYRVRTRRNGGHRSTAMVTPPRVEPTRACDHPVPTRSAPCGLTQKAKPA
jgi:hypothetical protein